MTAIRRNLCRAGYAVGAVTVGLAIVGYARAEIYSRESDVVELRLGQRVQVDDGMCPAGQIKEISGAQLSSAGVVRVVRCVERKGSKR